MVGTSSSSSSSCASLGSLDDVSVKPAAGGGTIKFLCSYGGKILPRYPDGKLRYVGGHTRVLAVDRSLPFSELQGKLGEMCGWGAVNLRCQLPTEDLDALVSVTSDEDLANLIEEYDLASRDRLLPLKIRAFLFPPPTKTPSPPSTPPMRKSSAAARPPLPADRCLLHQISAPSRLSSRPPPAAAAGNPRFRHHHHHHHHHQGNPRPHRFLVHHGNYWQ
ncbi:uncharacterized protein LOC103711999 [Phoenix dactylifera]|uniref:Uncharacterized protein LOC103711999 n=1 Tax=Phoenix dactylifera TaxID=42345 RepID=A0A8B8J774_PHODC|nr:uncharacterized protein LOC103711999 [Phoenix dactylifera]